MSSERAPLPKVRSQGTRARSYGSLVRSPMSSAQQRRIEHHVQPGETLQGLSLKYGVSMEQIKRANRLYTNDSIFLKKSVSIPVLTDTNHLSDTETTYKSSHERESEEQHGNTPRGSEEKPATPSQASELSPMDFLRRIDVLISQSKMAAVRNISEGEKQFACAEEAYSCSALGRQASARCGSASSVTRHRAALGAAPLTVTKHAEALRDREDEIFEL